MKTADEIKAELEAVVAEFFKEVERLVDDKGYSFDTAVMTVSKQRPDLHDREAALRDHLKALGKMEGLGLSTRDVEAWADRRRAGAISCGTVTRLAGAAKRLPIAQLGVRYKGAQRIEITREMLSEVVSNFRKRDTGQVPIDCDHSLETAAGSGGPVPAAGWVKSIDDGPDKDGILWGTVEWTPAASRMIGDGEYKFVSPVLDPNVRDNKTGKPQGWTLTSAALTNSPILQGMPALVLSEDGRVKESRRDAGQMNEWDEVNLETSRRVKATMAAKGLNHAAALQALMLSDRGLAERYQAAKNRYLANQGTAGYTPYDDGGSVASEIHALVKAKVAASEGRMGYSGAFAMVLSERRDLAERYKSEFGGAPR